MKIIHSKTFLMAIIFLLVTFSLIFKTWILPGIVAGGDMPFMYPQIMHNVPFLSSWGIRNNGMGSSMLPTLWLELYTTTTLKIFSFLDWGTYIRIVWFFPYLLFSAISSFLLGRRILKNGLFNILTPLLYVCNTYALLLAGGGQMGIALSYSLIPFGLLVFENFLRKLTLKTALIFSFLFSFVLLLDIRIGYILLWILAIRFLFEIPSLDKGKTKKYLFLFPLSSFLVAGFHVFWLLPIYLTHGAALRQFGDIYTSAGAVQFFSFAKFEDALGLLHPNWPENIFGLTHFMRPEFFLLPLLAYGSLLFIKLFDSLRSIGEKQGQLYVLFFALLGLVGAFLAKGANDPFGGIYLWMFSHVPGFIMFRDPTKWYLLIVLSYSMLIPYTVSKIYDFLQRRFA